MSLSENLLEVQPGSLLEKAFEAEGLGPDALADFASECMANGERPTSLPECLHKGTLIGPTVVLLSDVRRTVGVGPKTEIAEDTDTFYANVERIEERISAGFQPPPFIAQRRTDGWLYLLDGNHTKMALQRLKVPKWWTITLEPV